MNNLKFHKAAGLTTAVLLALLLAVPGTAQQNGQAEVLLQAAKYKQLVDGNLDQAIQMYKKILSRYSDNRPVAAKALVELGDCYEKLGKSGAEKAYQRVLHDYADQSAEVNEARARLAALEHGTHGNEMVARRIWTGPDVDVEGGVAPSGQYLSYTDWNTGNLAVHNLITGQNHRVTHKGSWSDSENFAENSVPSRDGREIAYAWWSGKHNTYELRVVGADGSSPHVVYWSPKVVYLEPKSWSPDGKEIVGTFWEKNGAKAQIIEVSVADGSTRVLKEFKSGQPHERFSPDGRFIAYDLNSGSKSPTRDIWIVSKNGGPAAPLVQHPSDDYLLGWSPDGKSVIFASNRMGSYGIWQIDVVDGKPSGDPKLLKPDFGLAWPLGLSRNGSLYYGIDTSIRDVYVASLDFSSGKLLKPATLVSQQSTGRNTGGAWSPDGKYLAYYSRRHAPANVPGPDTIVIRNLATGRERELLPKFRGMAWFYGVRWSADSQALYFNGTSENGQSGIFKIDIHTGNTRLLFKGIPEAIATPEPNTFVLHRYVPAKKTHEVVVDNVQSGKERVLFQITDPVWITGMSVSPDGKQVAFTTDGEPGRTTALRIVPVTGGEARVLLRLKKPELLMHASGLAWTRDGSRILFVKLNTAGKSRKTELWDISTKGGRPMNLGLSMPGIRRVHVHPDGHRIVFESDSSTEVIWSIPNFIALSRASR